MIDLLHRQPDLACRSQTSGDVTEQLLREPLLARFDVASRERCPQCPHPTIDVKAHTAHGHDPFIQIERSYAADGKAVARVDVGHGQGDLDNSGEAGHVPQLQQCVPLLPGSDVLQEVINDPPVPINPSGDEHLVLFGKLPDVI